MELLDKLNKQADTFFNYFPSYKERWKIIYGLVFLLLNILILIDFIIPRQSDIAYIYDQDIVEENLFLRSENTADFTIRIKNHSKKLYLIGKELFVVKTRIFGRIDPFIMLNEDQVYEVICNIRSNYFFSPILSILFTLLLIYNRFDDKDGVIDACFVCIIITLQCINLTYSMNAFMFLPEA